MKQFWVHLLEFLNLTGISELMAFIAWPGMLLGIGLILMGAFFSPSCFRAVKEGHSPLRNSKFKAALRAGGRLLVVMSGIILVIGSIAEGHRATKAFTEASLINAMANARPLLAEIVEQSEARLLHLERMKSYTIQNRDINSKKRDESLNDDNSYIEKEKNALAKIKYLLETATAFLNKH